MLNTEVNLDDDFFELGGLSLTSAALISKIRKTNGLDDGLSTLFDVRTARQLARIS